MGQSSCGYLGSAADACKTACLQGETQSFVRSSSPSNLVPVCLEEAGATDQTGSGYVGIDGGHEMSGKTAPHRRSYNSGKSMTSIRCMTTKNPVSRFHGMDMATIAYLRVSTGTQDIDQQRLAILASSQGLCPDLR